MRQFRSSALRTTDGLGKRPREGRDARREIVEFVDQSPAMTLIVAIIQDYDCDRLLRALTGVGLRATRIASTGGFLRMGNTTVFMGVPSDRADECVRIVKETCRRRVDAPSQAMIESLGLLNAGAISDVQLGGGVIFTKSICRFEQISRRGERQ
jgi:uncharacterized protein YaaQ